jgi:hypothetical protein
MNKLIAYLWSLWLRFRRRREISAIVRIGSRSELPDDLGRTLYIVGDPPKWATLQCPCGCGDAIDVNLMRSRNPVWRLSVVNEKPTIHPSLWVPPEKCGAHFWIRDGKITWV